MSLLTQCATPIKMCKNSIDTAFSKAIKAYKPDTLKGLYFSDGDTGESYYFIPVLSKAKTSIVEVSNDLVFIGIDIVRSFTFNTFKQVRDNKGYLTYVPCTGMDYVAKTFKVEGGTLSSYINNLPIKNVKYLPVLIFSERENNTLKMYNASIDISYVLGATREYKPKISDLSKLVTGSKNGLEVYCDLLSWFGVGIYPWDEFIYSITYKGFQYREKLGK